MERGYTEKERDKDSEKIGILVHCTCVTQLTWIRESWSDIEIKRKEKWVDQRTVGNIKELVIWKAHEYSSCRGEQIMRFGECAIKIT